MAHAPAHTKEKEDKPSRLVEGSSSGRAPREGVDTPTPRATPVSPTSAKLATVVDTHVTVFSPDELAVLNSAVTELRDYEDMTAPGEAPVNRDVPYAEQSGASLTCTMGNWDGEPDSYDYQWKRDGIDTGAGEATLPVTQADIDHAFTCVVTAHNAQGSTEAPPSNVVTVVDQAARSTSTKKDDK